MNNKKKCSKTQINLNQNTHQYLLIIAYNSIVDKLFILDAKHLGPYE
jgi:hypothetical protein